MLVIGLLHVAIKAKDLAGTIRFYEEILGLRQAPRPNFGSPGAWMACSTPGAEPIIHLYGGDTARDDKGGVPVGTAAIDHISISSHGYRAMIERLDAHGLDWRAFAVPGTSLWQIFTYDPNGVQLELTFDAAAEREPMPPISEARRSRTGANFFDPSLYRAFESADAVAG
jgi:catechol 2,3-dioxygenase-like lactoylglutathione lyase family enzyme